MKGFNAEIVTWKVVVAVLGLTLLLGAGPVYAQSPADPHHPPAAVAASAPGGAPEPQGGGTMPMMDMCRQMMAGPMMGMGGDQKMDAKMDPKMMANMLQMRGEMMKAMGEVMMKHGAMMQGGAMK